MSYEELNREQLIRKVELLTNENKLLKSEFDSKEKELNEKLKFFENVIKLSPNYVYVKDTECKYILSNYNFAELCKLPLDQIYGKTSFDIFPPETAERMYNEDKAILEEKIEQIEDEEEFIDNNGNSAWAYTVKYPLKDSSGKVKYIIGISIDITKRMEIEKVLIEREQGYRSLVESSIDAIYVLQDNRLVMVNKAWENLFGYSKESVMRDDFDLLNIVAPEDRPMIIQRFKNLQKTKPLYSRYELKAYTKDKRILDVEVSVALIKWNGRDAYQGIYRNITERKKTEYALKREAFIFENLLDAVILTDHDGIVLNWNPAAEKLYGYKKEEILNSNVEILNTPEEQRKITVDIIRGIRDHGKWSGEINFIMKDGTKGISETIVFPFMDADGNQIALVGVNRDITTRKESELALSESEDKFRKLAEFSLTGIYLIQDGLFKYVNPKFAEFFGYEQDEIINKKGPNDLTYKEDQSMVDNYISQRLVGDLDSIKYEFLGVKKNSNLINVEVHGARLLYQGKAAIVGTLLDITQRKQSEKDLYESRKKYKELTDLLPQTIFEADIQGNFTFVNKAGIQIFGYSDQDFKETKTIYQLLGSKDRERAKIELANSLYGKSSDNNEYIGLKKDGTEFPIMVFSSPVIRNEKPVGFRGIVIDISERKEYEEQLRKLSRVVEQSPDSIIITNIDGNIEYVNPKFTELTGYTFKEVTGENPRILKSGEKPADEYSDMWELITHGKMWRGEFHNKKKNGELYWESASISPIINSDGKVTHYLAIKEDITQKKIIEQELIKAKEKAEESDRLKSEFLAQMSHEIRSPLNVIMSFNSLLKEELVDTLKDDHAAAFSAINSAGKRLLRTIDLILNMAAVQTGNIEFIVTDIDLKKVISGLKNEFDYLTTERNLKIELDFQTNNTTILADEYLVSEIFQNLINNAVKYTIEGSVNIKIYENEYKNVSVDISDTGIGISKEYIPKLFKPFSQEDTGYSRKFEGNGLGLALVKNYIDLIGATVKVVSEKGKGTTFTVSFPDNASIKN